MQKVWQKPLLHFVERRTQASRALSEAAEGYTLMPRQAEDQ